MIDWKPIVPTGLILTAPASAAAQFSLGDTLGTDAATIRAAVKAQGYVIEEIEQEDGEIEVEVLKDGVETKIVLNMVDGTIIGMELEEDDND